MMPVNDCSGTTLLKSSVCGVIRGLFVQGLISPLEVIKIRQQCGDVPEKSAVVALRVLQEEGWRALYKGMAPKLINTTIKQIWVWPMIREFPLFLGRRNIKGMRQEVLTGLAIALVDASLSSPLDRARILSAYTGKNQFSIQNLCKQGWQGFSTQLTKLSVHWVVFLVAQKSLRNHYRSKRAQELSVPQLVLIGTQVAVITSIVSSPFDIVNTRKQAQNCKVSDVFSRCLFRDAFRGAPLSLTANIIHCIASLLVIEYLSERSSCNKWRPSL